MNPAIDLYFMALALEDARQAGNLGEVPVGALLVQPNQIQPNVEKDLEGWIISRAQNARETKRDPTAHAEILALQKASQRLDRWRMSDLTMYVTLEPCAMCAGALVNARIKRLVYAAKDPKGGAVCSLFQICEDNRLNHRVEVTSDIFAEESAILLRSFFQKKRKKSASNHEEPVQKIEGKLS